MEEDIKIIKASKIMSDDIPHSEHSKRLRKALENLIKGYRELEEREIWSTATINGLKRDFIPKSKIKEIRDKAEVMDYYVLGDVIDDLNKMLEDK